MDGFLTGSPDHGLIKVDDGSKRLMRRVMRQEVEVGQKKSSLHGEQLYVGTDVNLEKRRNRRKSQCRRSLYMVLGPKAVLISW